MVWKPDEKCLFLWVHGCVFVMVVFQACPILTTCSSRESGDSTRTSRTSRKTMVTSGSICSSRDMILFSEINEVLLVVASH